MARRRTRAWLTPSASESGLIGRSLLIPLEYLPAVGGALAALTEPANWERYGDITPEQAAERMAAMLYSWSGEIPSGDAMFNLRIAPTDQCLVQRTDDGGLTWQDFFRLDECALTRIVRNPQTRELGYSRPSTPTTFYRFPDGPWGQSMAPWQPTLPPGSGDADKCLAAWRALDVLRELYNQTWRPFSLGIPTTVLELAMSAIDLLENLPIPVNILDDMLETGMAEYAAAWDENHAAFWAAYGEELACELMCNASDSTGTIRFNHTSFVGKLQALGTAGQGVAKGLVILLRFLDADALNIAGTVNTRQTADCADCNCPETWCYEFDFTTGQQGFAVNENNGWWAGQYVAGQGFGQARTRNENKCAAAIVRTFSPAISGVRAIEMDYFRTTPASASENLEIHALGQRKGFNDSPAGEGTVRWSFDNLVNVASLGGINETEFACTTAYIRRIRLYGEGTNPLGTDNC